MAVAVVEVDQFDATVTVPQDGDTKNAASVTAAGVGFQAVTNRTLWLSNRNIATAGGSYLIPLSPMKISAAADRFSGSTVAAVIGCLVQDDITDTGTIYFDVPHLVGATMTQVVARVHADPNAIGPRPGLPGTMPALALYECVPSTGAVTQIGTQTDTSGTVVAYESLHSITLAFAAQTFDSDSRYILRFNGEFDAGGNDLASGLHLYALTATIVVT